MIREIYIPSDMMTGDAAAKWCARLMDRMNVLSTLTLSKSCYNFFLHNACFCCLGAKVF